MSWWADRKKFDHDAMAAKYKISPEMVRAGTSAIVSYSPDFEPEGHRAIEVYVAMIDAKRAVKVKKDEGCGSS